MKKKTALAAAIIASMFGALPAVAQDETTTTKATTPTELIEALQAAGYDLSDIITVNEDGTVSVKVPADFAEVAPTEETPAEAPPAEAGDDKKPDAVAMDDSGAAVEPEPESEVVWDNKLTIGFGLAAGNSENANLNIAHDMTGAVEGDWKFSWKNFYFFSSDGGDTSNNRFTSFAQFDKDLDEKWIWFINGQFDWDEFQSWDYRLGAHTGFGYRLINEDTFKLTPRFAVGAIREFGSDRDEIIPEGQLGADLDWNITERQSLAVSSYYYPSFKSFDDYRIVTTAAWKIDIDKADGLAISVGLFHEYNAIVDPGRDNNDFRLFGGLTFDF